MKSYSIIGDFMVKYMQKVTIFTVFNTDVARGEYYVNIQKNIRNR